MNTRLVGVAVLLASSPAYAVCPVPGFNYAAFGDIDVTLSGGASTDSYDSSLGTYAATKLDSSGNLGTNSKVGGAVKLSGGVDVNGSIAVGAGGVVGTVITSSGGSTYQSGSVLATAVTLSSVTIPTVGTNQGNLSIKNTFTATANQTYGAVKLTAGAVLTLPSGTYVFDSLSLSGNSSIQVSGAVIVYIRTDLDLSGGTVVNSTHKSTNLVFFGADAVTTIKVTGGTSASYAVYAPKADINTSGGAAIYGALVGKSIKNSGGSTIHYDRSLAEWTGGPFTCPREVTRAAPVIATISSQAALVQGTYEYPFDEQKVIATTADVATFAFPYIHGHVRARTTSSVTTTAAKLTSGTMLFDAGATGKIPAAMNTGCSTFKGTCRNVFTTTATPGADGVAFHPPRVQLNDGNASAIGALIAPASAVPGITATHWQTIVRKVIAAPLGGVDRSTVAVAPASSFAGSASRPTIVYFGGTDGMVHAVCASTGGTTDTATNICPSLGTELWAFLPRTQLPLVRRNTTRIDGSMRILDAFGDFTSASAAGTRSWRTILTFQTGYADATIAGATPAMYALDVTDPAQPIVLWERTKATSPEALDFGVGLTVSGGTVIIGGSQKNVLVAQTNNGGTGTAGSVTTAVSTETGARLWQFDARYASPPRGDNATTVPASGIPGGAVGVDLAGAGYLTHFVFGDLFGSLWIVDAATGTSRTGESTPLFQFSTNKHPIGAPPAIYSVGGQLYAAFASGAYADHLATSWSATAQYLIAVKLTQSGNYPFNEAAMELAINEALASGDKAMAQVLVVGGQLFVATDTADMNQLSYGASSSASTGKVLSYNLATEQTTTVVVRGGASSLANQGTTRFNSSSDRQQQLATGATTTTGSSVDVSDEVKLRRLLWLSK